MHRVDEELRPARSRLTRVRHTQRPDVVRGAIVEFIRDASLASVALDGFARGQVLKGRVRLRTTGTRRRALRVGRVRASKLLRDERIDLPIQKSKVSLYHIIATRKKRSALVRFSSRRFASRIIVHSSNTARAQTHQHEISDDAVKVQSIVKSRLGQIDEIRRRDRHLIEVKLRFKRALGRVENCDWIPHVVRSFVYLFGIRVPAMRDRMERVEEEPRILFVRSRACKLSARRRVRLSDDSLIQSSPTEGIHERRTDRQTEPRTSRTMGDYEARANEAFAKGEKKLKSSSLFSSLMGGNKHDEAAECFQSAANGYKLAKSWDRAATAYVAVAECREKLGEYHDAATARVDAAAMCKKYDALAAIEHYRAAVKYYTELGRLSQAAKHLKEIGEAYEGQNDENAAVVAYTQAADLYESEESSSTTANNCKLKVATLCAKLDRFEEATEIFEDVARASLNNNLLKYSAKGYFLQAGICRLCWNDPIGVLNACERYEENDPAFSGSRERELLVGCAKAAENGDQDEFSNVVAEFDSMSRLDGWKTTMLLKAKKRIEKHVEAEEDDLT